MTEHNREQPPADGPAGPQPPWWSRPQQPQPPYPPADLGAPPRGPEYVPGRAPPPVWGAFPGGPGPGAPPLPAASGSRPPSRLSAGLVGVALLAGLLGGGVGGAIGVAYERDRSSGQTVTSSAPPLSTGAPTPVDRSPTSVASIAARVLPSVVTINVRGGGEQGSGSGVILRPDGYVLTNNHVVAPAANGGDLTVDLYKGGKGLKADIVGRDDKTDLAVIKIQNSAGMPAAVLGQSKSLVVGDPVVAIGAPLQLSGSVTSGIVSALDRNVTVPADGGGTSVLIGAIQTDAAINPGNSGGALVDSRAQVIGINSAIATLGGGSSSGQSGSIGLGFAIPVDYARSIAEEIIRTGKATHPYVGVTAQTLAPDQARANNSEPGAVIQSVVPRGPADQAGLRPGDIITKVNDQTVSGVNDLVAATRLHKAGDEVTVTYVRGGETKSVRVRLQENPR